MIGNDVVDLRDPEVDATGLHPRFDAFVFTAAERAQLDASADRGHLRWTLWAAKEAAYKVARKRDPGAVFAPARFHVARETHSVHHGDERYLVSIEEHESFVHAVATDSASPDAIRLARVAPLHAATEPGAAARALALDELTPMLGAVGLEIRREQRIPVLYRGSQRLPCDLSLSHHGRYVAFACELREERHAA